MARGRSPDYADQREAILARAAELFAQRGYPATTMNAVAEAAGLSKPTLYHYFRDKEALLVSIAEGHVERLEALVRETAAQGLPAEERLERLIVRFVEAYADAQHAHRVLTEDVRFMKPDDRARVLGKERRVVDAFADAIAELRPDARRAALHTPLAMLLFGMINWMFTWLQPGGALTHAAMAPIVADLFRGGLSVVKVTRRARAVAGQPL
jgi:TetR/AcrR family transcriptional regulator